MAVFHPAYAILITVFAVTVFFVANLKAVTPLPQGRFTSIDGLRGYLAFFVFLHHASIWYFYIHTGTWRAPESHLYNHLGKGSVSMFFMITSFLFYTKILDTRGKIFDWPAFFVSRFFRLAPIYFFAMGGLFMLVAIVSKGVLHDSITWVTRCVLTWLSFTILDVNLINGVKAPIIMAGVTWSLPYEWYFYFSLPLLAATVGVRAAWPFILLSAASIAFASTRGLSLHYAYVFLAGIAAALLVRHERFQRFSTTRSASILVVISILSLLLFPTVNRIEPLILLMIAFSLIAGGNSLFGILSCAISRQFGDLAYSIYLLHGMLLFITFNFLVGLDSMKGVSPTIYWLIVAAIVPILLVVCSLTHRFIERPGMKFTPRVLKFWRKPGMRTDKTKIVPKITDTPIRDADWRP
jgi:peptidoglycan/LPS O-acetylase OafA/YrhL